MRSTTPGTFGFAAIILLLAVWSAPCEADDFYVTITADTNDGICPPPFQCSLRDAILTANANPGEDNIHVPPGVYNLTIPGAGENGGLTGDLDITGEVNIYGSGAGVTIIDGLGNDRVFHCLGQTGRFYDLTIRGGEADFGGGIAATQTGLMTIARCIIEDNVSTATAVGGGGLWISGGDLYILDTLFCGNEAALGSAIHSDAGTDLVVTRSTIAGNYCRNDLPGPSNGGAVVVRSDSAELVNSTIFHNENLVASYAGGINVLQGAVVIHSCTFADNDGYAVFSNPTGAVEFRNTIIRGRCTGPNLYTAGGNIEGPGDTCSFLAPGDYIAAQVYLMTLGDYGGLTPTMPPEVRPDNVAIDNEWAENVCLLEDQRGISRPQDGDNDNVAVCDSGAVEIDFVPAVEVIFACDFEFGDLLDWSVVVP